MTAGPSNEARGDSPADRSAGRASTPAGETRIAPEGEKARAAEAAPPRLRTVFCTRGGLFGALVLHRLLACERIEICAIVRSSRNFNPRFGFLRGALAYLRRSGIAYTLYLFWATTIADLVCAFSRSGGVPLRTRAGGPPVYRTRDLNDPEGLSFLRSCAPDLLVSAFFDQRLRESALAVPARASVNIHPSLLPDFKGVDPVLQTRLHDADRVGVTVHYMTPTLDTGDILIQRVVSANTDGSVFETTALLFKEGAELLAEAVDQIAAGQPGAPQSGAGSYQSWPTRAEVRVHRARGRVLLRLSDFARFTHRLHPAALDLEDQERCCGTHSLDVCATNCDPPPA